MKNKKQIWLVVAGFLLIQIFYFGFDTVQLDRDQTIGADGEVVNEHAWDDHLDEVLEALNAEDRQMVKEWMDKADDQQIVALKQLASFWVTRSEWEIGGHYLETIARLTTASEDWMSAARTYATGAQQAEDELHRTILREKALSSYDAVVLQDNDSFEAELEKALFLIKSPDPDNPMTGVLALVEMSNKYPDQPEVFVHLGKFSIQTGQWDKARERLERALELNPDHRETICLLATVYSETGDSAKSEEYSRRCESI